MQKEKDNNLTCT